MSIGRNLGVFILLIGLFFGFYLFLEYFGIKTSLIFSIALATMPIWLPVTTFYMFFEKWVEFVQFQADLKVPRVTLEIILPQEIFKSPLAMELVLNQLYQKAGADNHIQTYWEGKHPPTFSLELVSTHGHVRFLINTQIKFKNMIESQLYAQYPGVEVRQLPVDYTAEIPKDGAGYWSHSFHYKLTKADAYPIKTYIDYGLDKNPKEEEKIDPISVTLESLAALGPNEHMWVQILIKANRSYDFKSGSLKAKSDWKGGVKAEIKKIISEAKERNGENGGPPQLTDGERDMIASLERSVSKYAFDAKIQGTYLATEEAFNGGRIGTLASILRSSDDLSRNMIGITWDTNTPWPWWQDRKGQTTKRWKKEEIENMKRRSYTERHKKDTGMVLTTEELATIFHLPGAVVTSGNVRRVGSLRSEAPGNLPI